MIPKISINQYTYHLPDEYVARFPLAERDQSKLLVYQHGKLVDDTFLHLANYIDNDSMLVFNNTKVIRARLLFYKDTGARIEVFCLEPCSPSTFEQALAAKHTCTWQCTVGNLKKWKDDQLMLQTENGLLTAKKVDVTNNSVKVQFEWNSESTFGELMEQLGAIPIPPYLKRESEDIDNTRYQTVYSKHQGSVAAPTAGLHFTQNALNTLNNKNITTAELTLHVGAGTFKPVKSEYIEQHDMHTEHFMVTIDTLKRIAEKVGKIIAVGTTSVRTLESLYWLGVDIDKTENYHVNQWTPYINDTATPVDVSLNNIINHMESKGLTTLNASTQIMIVPSYRFRIIRGLITNFHQPQSTLLLLIAALIGSNWKQVYQHALSNNYRFLSYGDSSLLLP